MREIDDALCSRAPQLCNQFDTSEAPPPADESTQGGRPLEKSVSNWKSNRYAQAQKGYSLENSDEAERRAQICAQCPHNQDWDKEGCVPCIVESQRVLMILRQGKETPTRVKGCDLTGWDNSTAVWLQPDMLVSARRVKEQLPSFCWVKELL